MPINKSHQEGFAKADRIRDCFVYRFGDQIAVPLAVFVTIQTPAPVYGASPVTNPRKLILQFRGDSDNRILGTQVTAETTAVGDGGHSHYYTSGGGANAVKFVHHPTPQSIVVKANCLPGPADIQLTDKDGDGKLYQSNGAVPPVYTQRGTVNYFTRDFDITFTGNVTAATNITLDYVEAQVFGEGRGFLKVEGFQAYEQLHVASICDDKSLQFFADLVGEFL